MTDIAHLVFYFIDIHKFLSFRVIYLSLLYSFRQEKSTCYVNFAV